jgi:glycosyltransferase involved in cell wall biosynthesis
MIKLSVAIITLNEEKNLERCLRSLTRIADEIVIVDSLSTDNTTTIAQQFNVKIVTHSFAGFVEQKNIATDNCTNDWVLSIDADEVVSPELEQNIISIKNNPQHSAYTMARLTNYCGKWIKHGGWYPDRKLRLFNKTAGRWTGDMVHEKWQLHDRTKTIGKLNGNLLHYSFHCISDHIKKIEKYTEMSARAAAERGKTCSIVKIIVVPQWNFFVNYILRLGFLDGYYGLLVCKFTSHESQVKYAKTRQYAKWKKAGKVY